MPHPGEICDREVLIYVNAVPYKKVLIRRRDNFVKIVALEKVPVMDYKNTDQKITCRSFEFPVEQTEKGNFFADASSPKLEIDDKGALRLIAARE